MPIPVTPTLDDFNRSNETPVGAPYGLITSYANLPNLASNSLRNGSAPANAGAFWPTAYGPSWEFWYVFSAVGTTGGDFFEADITIDPTDTTGDGYYLYLQGDGYIEIGKFIAGVVTNLGSTTLTPIAVNDAVLIRKTGTTLTAWVRRSGTWGLVLTSSDGSFADGLLKPGLGFGDDGTGFAVDTFGGGTIAADGTSGGWALRAVSPVATGSISLTITKPTGTVDNDIMLMCLSHKGIGWAVVPAGWTLIRQAISGVIRGELYWRRASGEGANYSITGLADTACGFIVSYPGGLLVGNVVADSAVSANPSGTETCPSVTPTGENQLVFAMVASALNNAITPGGPLTAGAFTYTEVADGGTSNGTDSRVEAMHTVSPTAAATGTIAFSMTNADNVAITVALIPEPSPGPGDTAFRFYPTLVPPNVRVEGPVPGTWDMSAPILNGLGWGTDFCNFCLPNKTLGGTKDDQVQATNQQGNFDVYFAQWNTPPLAAQTIRGTFDLCFMTNVRWETPTTNTDESQAVYKVHVAVMVGQTGVVRHVLLDNYVDSVEFQRTFAVGRWQLLAAPQVLTVGDTQEGDTVRIVTGHRLVSSPTPPPIYPSEPFNIDQNTSQVTWRGLGTTATAAGVGLVDAPPGNTTSTSFSPWFEFTGGLVLSSAVIPPNANDECTEAVVVSSIPYRSPAVDTSGGILNYRPAWYTFVAPRDGTLFVSQYGSTYCARLEIFTGGCGVLTPVATITGSSIVLAPQRGRSVVRLTVTAGTQYWIAAFSQSVSGLQSRVYGGLFQLVLFYRETPEEDDLYLPCLQTVAFRRYPDGSLFPVNVAFTESLTPTGIAIDYTRRPLNDINLGGVNTNERVLVASHASPNLIEILDINTFGEVDFIADSVNIDDVNLNKHIGQIHIDPNGELVVGYFGNGYLYVEGEGTVIPAALNSISDEARFANPQSMSAAGGNSQPGAPFAATTHAVDRTPISPWAVSRLGDVLYYVSGGFYVPVGGQTIKRWNLATQTQLANFATLSASLDTFMPGMKGLEVLPDGTVLATNATYAVRLSVAGTVIQTFTPSRTNFFRSICDIKATANGTKVWVVDEDTASLALFDILTGDEIATYDTWLAVGSLVQMAIYQPEGVSSPPNPEDCPDSFLGVAPTPAPVSGFLDSSAEAQGSSSEECGFLDPPSASYDR